MNLLLAPMHGTTTSYYRNLYDHLFGNIDTYYAPFIGTTSMRKPYSPVFNDLLPENNKPSLQLVPQLLGNNKEDFLFFARRIARMGYKEINWNIGCPYEKVTRKKKGSGILPYPDMIHDFLDYVCQDTTYQVSVKMRLGLNSVDEGAKVIEVLNDYPLKNVIIHARVGTQKYHGHVDLDDFETLYNKSKHKITYNGDIYSVNSFQSIRNRFPNIENFMLGRGALQNPFLPSAIKGIQLSTPEKLSIIQDFHNKMYQHFKTSTSTEIKHLNQMKEFWMYIGMHIDSKGQILKTIRRCSTLNEYNLYTKQIFKTIKTWND